MKTKKVLSLFDGLSGGQIALEQAGIKHDGYYASEIDKYAMKVANALYPDTIQLGDITNWQNWAIDWADIGYIFGGFPCQSHSFAGKGKGFADPRGQLFFVLMEVVEFVKSFNPGVKFLFENVKMKKESVKVISDRVGVEPMLINSALVSAQNRNRLYWLSWKCEQPEDRNIFLKDIIEEGYVDKEKSYCIDACYYKGCNLDQYFNKSRRQLVFKDEKLYVQEATKKGYAVINANEGVDLTFLSSKTRRGRRMAAKSNCLTATNYDYCWYNGKDYRKLTVRECARLQTIPEHLIDIMLSCGVSNSQLYKMLGNGWTCEVIAHILRAIK